MSVMWRKTPVSQMALFMQQRLLFRFLGSLCIKVRGFGVLGVFFFGGGEGALCVWSNSALKKARANPKGNDGAEDSSPSGVL